MEMLTEHFVKALVAGFAGLFLTFLVYGFRQIKKIFSTLDKTQDDIKKIGEKIDNFIGKHKSLQDIVYQNRRVIEKVVVLALRNEKRKKIDDDTKIALAGVRTACSEAGFNSEITELLNQLDDNSIKKES